MAFIKHRSALISTESQLLQEFRVSGDLEVLGALYQPYMPLVYGLCLKYLKDESESKDAVMQIFEELIKKLRVFEVSNFKSWLYSLSRNHCLMILRAKQKHAFVSLEDQHPESSSFDVDIEDINGKEGKLNALESCIQKLPDEQRVTIDLFYLQQKCYKEIAEITGFDLNKVKSYIQNGKRNLKLCMEKNRGNE